MSSNAHILDLSQFDKTSIGTRIEDRPKSHYVSLDGLRGFAALAVLLYHLGHWLNKPALAINSGLSVDLFFCLSGFVLPYAYQSRLNRLSTLQFLKTRLFRLYPLILLAIAVSAAYVIVRNRVAALGASNQAIVASVLLAIMNLPYFAAPKSVGGPLLFPLNGPQYTLFLELFINIFWWATRRLDQIRLSLTITAVSLCPLFFTGLHGDLPEDFWTGFPRVGASFFAGVAMFHLQRQFTGRYWRLVFFILFALMALIFFFPVQAPLPLQIMWVALLSPLLVLAGSKTVVPVWLNRLFSQLGLLSYPIYVLHYPLFCWVNGVYRSHFKAQNFAVECPIVITVVLAASFLATKLYDEPIRRALAHLSSPPKNGSTIGR